MSFMLLNQQCQCSTVTQVRFSFMLYNAKFLANHLK